MAGVQVAAEEVEVVLEGLAEGRVPVGRAAGQDRGLPVGRGNQPEEGREPENKCRSNTKSR